ncbi:hypothetical protein [Deinococcus sp.]|uniref:hypothetical protein n=1 Tax=Deinococcus sp. TaxID=47478 RepID=UPI003B59DB38
MSEDVLLDDLRRASLWPKAVLRLANESGEHFFAGHKLLGAHGLPQQPRVHLSIAPGGRQAMWQRGNAPDLYMHLLSWAGGQGYRVRLDYTHVIDEQGDEPQCDVTIFEVEQVAQARARDPLSALLRVLVLADDHVPAAPPSTGETYYGVWSGQKSR